MAKKEKAIYSPGELDKVRNRLGVTDTQEAKRMAAVLGGEVGVERGGENSAKPQPGKKPGSAVDPEGTGRRQPKHRIELAFSEDETDVLKEAAARRPADPADDPLIPVKASYLERVKMDRFCALPEFRIKSATQAIVTMLSIFGEPPDLVNPVFINKKLDNYYKKLEQLITSVRTLFPRNNMKRNEQFKRLSPFAYTVLDILRYWNLEKMASDMAKIQAHPRNVTISEFTGILKVVYRPLFLLENLETDEHIKGAFKLLYKVLYLENPNDAKERAQGLIHEALFSFNEIRQDIHYYLYPLLMKLLSDRFIPYENFFSARRNRFMTFIEASEADRVDPARMAAELKAGKDIEEDAGENKEDDREESKELKEEDPNDPEVIKNKEKEAARKKERKAMLQGVASLEALFPKAGWERLSGFPDIYPYFRDVYKFKRSYELISPADPLLQFVVIIRILEDLFLGLRNIRFGTVISGEGGPVQVNEILNGVLSSWQNYIDFPLEKEYLPRLSEYCRILEQSAESRSSNYAKRLLCELHWIKRLFFFPYYKFDTLFPPPFQKKEIEPVYPAIRSLRRSLALVAGGIEQANRIGGAEKMVPCDGIDNPWEPYEFAIPNPMSTRLDALLPQPKQNNATLVFFSLAFSTVLDHLVNDENSWAYREDNPILFRNLHGVPQMGVDKKIDADAIFKESIRQRENEK
ncbi:MAG: hypothetical protein LBU19_03225 [Treponema sp.]|jgi:hypothetical protein|nr:hypothetical protein [Treponema sp.]